MLKFHSITSAALMLLSSVAFAQQASAPSSASAGLTRAEVQAELAWARANGELAMLHRTYGEEQAEPILSRAAGAQGRPFAGPGLTRAEVKAELARAIASGELAIYGEAQAEPIVSRAAGAQGRPFAASGLTREEVKAELARARASGEMARYWDLYSGGSD